MAPDAVSINVAFFNSWMAPPGGKESPSCRVTGTSVEGGWLRPVVEERETVVEEG
jgi:hypothetical protein